MIVADNGSSWFLSGEPSTRWNDDDLHRLTSILGSNFEAVRLNPDVTSLDQTSGSTGGGTAVTIHGDNFSGAAGQLKVFFGATQSPSITIVSDTMLIAASPAHSAGAVDVTVQTPYDTSHTSSADRFTFTATGAASVVARQLFYNQSAFDGGSAALNASDNGAIAPDKSAYLPGSGLASAANVSSYSRGINGILIDLSPSGGSHASITAADFVFKVGNNNLPGSWTAAPAPSAVSVILAGGTGGSDRVKISWTSGAIKNQWLEVQVLATARTGLSASDVFFWGNKIADSQTGSPPNNFETTSTDAAQVFATLTGSAAISNPRDYNRDGTVNSTDASIVFASLGSIQRITIGAGGPFAPRGPVIPASPRHWLRRRRVPSARPTRRLRHRRIQSPD